jgi:hypothetical protein
MIEQILDIATGGGEMEHTFVASSAAVPFPRHSC